MRNTERSELPTQLDTLVIRDATAQEKEELAYLAREIVENADSVPIREANLGGITDRGSECLTARSGRDTYENGFMTNRSERESIQLTGIKPKALVFESPMKSPQKATPHNQAIPTPTTKD